MKRCPQCGKQYAGEANFCPVDAGRLEDVPDAAAADTDEHVLGGRFVVGERLGGGLTGHVFKAIDKESGHPCVIKWVDAAVFTSPLQLQRTERELKQLERQEAPGIARVLGHGRREEQLWIATEYVAGTALHELVGHLGSLPLERATKIVHDVGVALAEAAKLGVIHRDVAPKNVLVGDGDEVHVINFGVAVPATPQVRGTPEFVAPEQVDGKPVDQRSNIYSLGAMLYAIVVGRPPFEGDPEAVHNAHLHVAPPAASSSLDIDPAKGAALDRVLERALAKQSAKRFMTLRQLLAELEALADIEPASTQRMAPTSTSGPAPAAEGANGKGKGKASRRDEPAQTLLGVAAFERPKTGSGVVVAPTPESPSGVAALAPPVTEPPPMAHSEPAHAGMPVLTPAAYAEPDDPADAARTTALPTASRPIVHEQPALSPLAQAQAQAHFEGHAPALAVAQAGQAEARPSSEEDAASGKRRKRRTKKKTAEKSKFRETMWFKKGELDEAAAEAASAAASGSLVSAKADELPEDERYKDDGSLSAEDQERLSLRTGHTQMMSAMDEAKLSGAVPAISDEELAAEMTGGRKRLLIAAGVAAVVILLIIIIVASQ